MVDVPVLPSTAVVIECFTPSWMTCRGPSRVPTRTSRRTPRTRRCTGWWRSTRGSTTWADTSPTTKDNHTRWRQPIRPEWCIVYTATLSNTLACNIIRPKKSTIHFISIVVLSERSETRQFRRLQPQCGTHGGSSEALLGRVRPLSGRLRGGQSAFTAPGLLCSHGRLVCSF